MKDGNKFTFPTGGTLKDTFYSNSFWLVDDEDPEEARAAVLAGDGKEYQQNGEEKTSTAPSKYLARSFQAWSVRSRLIRSYLSIGCFFSSALIGYLRLLFLHLFCYF